MAHPKERKSNAIWAFFFFFLYCVCVCCLLLYFSLFELCGFAAFLFALSSTHARPSFKQEVKQVDSEISCCVSSAPLLFAAGNKKKLLTKKKNLLLSPAELSSFLFFFFLAFNALSNIRCNGQVYVCVCVCVVTETKSVFFFLPVPEAPKYDSPSLLFSYFLFLLSSHESALIQLSLS